MVEQLLCGSYNACGEPAVKVVRTELNGITVYVPMCETCGEGMVEMALEEG